MRLRLTGLARFREQVLDLDSHCHADSIHRATGEAVKQDSSVVFADGQARTSIRVPWAKGHPASARSTHTSYPVKERLGRHRRSPLAGTRDSSMMRTKSLSAMRIERPNL